MVTASATAHLPQAHLDGLPMQVKARTLLIMMLAVPAGIIAALIDTYGFDGALRHYSMSNPVMVSWWVAVLSTPHIIASLVTFADKEYVHHYAPYLVKGSIVAIALGFCLPFAAGSLLKPEDLVAHNFVEVASYGAQVSLIAAAAYTTYHNLQQQYGIAAMLMREKQDFPFHLWKWVTIVPASFIFIGLNFFHTGEQWELWPFCLAIAAANLPIAVGVAGYIIWRHRKRPDHSRIGLAYFCANAAMVFVCFGLAAMGHILIALLLPRVVHDLTAYWIYMVHDENRNAAKMRNPFYALPARIGARPVWLCIPLSFIIGYALLEVSEGSYIISFLVISLNYIHYYLEGIIWKRGTPHRQHVPFV